MLEGRIIRTSERLEHVMRCAALSLVPRRIILLLSFDRAGNHVCNGGATLLDLLSMALREEGNEEQQNNQEQYAS